MKVKHECASCGSGGKRRVTLTIKPEDRDSFLEFTEYAQQVGKPGTIPPSKYPKNPLLIPAPGENPCPHCKHGEDFVGPGGCGRGQSCLAYAYFQLHQMGSITNPDTNAFKDFTCAVPTALWLSPKKKTGVARSAAAAPATKPVTSSVPTASARKSARRK